MFLFALQKKILIIQIQFWMPVSCNYPPLLLLCPCLQFPTHPMINQLVCFLMWLITREEPLCGSWRRCQWQATVTLDPPDLGIISSSQVCSVKTGQSIQPKLENSRFQATVCHLFHRSGTVQAHDRNCETVQVQAVWLLDKHTQIQRRLNWNLSL